MCIIVDTNIDQDVCIYMHINIFIVVYVYVSTWIGVPERSSLRLALHAL